MTHINIKKPTGTIEVLNLLSAFRADNNIYVILDSEKMGSMGLPIIYVSKYTNRFEKINDVNEWQSVKNYLKGIINGTNFEYVKLSEQINADEAYYTPLTLPQASFDLIKSRYKLKDSITIGENVSASDLINETGKTLVAPVENAVPVTPIIPNNNVQSNANVRSVPVAPVVPEIEPIKAVPIMQDSQVKMDETIVKSFEPRKNDNSFDTDKETFLKACENMFDALISKYQKQLSDLERRENELAKKEQDIENKLKNASEHLANAQAREQVANIAHDNAQKIMDISNLMPNNPNEV